MSANPFTSNSKTISEDLDLNSDAAAAAAAIVEEEEEEEEGEEEEEEEEVPVEIFSAAETPHSAEMVADTGDAGEDLVDQHLIGNPSQLDSKGVAVVECSGEQVQTGGVTTQLGGSTPKDGFLNLDDATHPPCVSTQNNVEEDTATIFTQQTQVVDETAFVAAQVSEMSTSESDGYPTFVENTSSGEAELLAQSVELFPKQDFSLKEDTCPMLVEEHETLLQLSEPVSNQVNQSPNEEIHLSVDSTSLHKGSGPSQASTSCGSQHTKEEPDAVLVDVYAAPSANINACSEIQLTKVCASEDEMQEAGIEVVMADQVSVINELVTKEIQVSENSIENCEILQMKDGIVGTDALDWKPLYIDGKQILEAEAVAVGSGYPPNGDFIHKEESAEDKKQEMVVQSTETVLNELAGNEKTKPYPVSNALNETFCVIADSNSGTKALSRAQAADVRAFQFGEIETLAVREAGYFRNVNPDSEFQVTEDRSSSIHADRNIDTHVSPINTTKERNQIIDVGSETDRAGLSFKLAANQIVRSHGSEAEVLRLSRNEHIMGASVEDLDSFPCTHGDWKARNEFIKEVMSPPGEPYGKVAKTNEVGDSLRFSLFDDSHQNSFDGVREVDPVTTQNVPTGFDQGKCIEKQVIYPDALETEICCGRELAASHTLEPEKEGVFSVSDLVWGKVKSHPWWPGQIFDFSDASERALKYKKKDSFLVAYFGDQTFAWNEASSLNHFQSQFTHMEKQSNSEAFRTAVDYALDEVCRRVEVGMICSCTPKEVHEKVKYQVVENAGIRKKVRRLGCVDNSLTATSFEPAKLLQYIKALAPYPCGEGDNRLELKIAQAQLLAFYRLKGYCRLPKFHVYGGLFEEGVDSSLSGDRYPSQQVIKHEILVSENDEQTLSAKAKLKTRYNSSHRWKYGSDGGPHPSRKKRSLSDLMAGRKAHLVNSGKKGVDERTSSKSASSSGIKRKAIDSNSEDSAVKNMKRMPSFKRDVDTESPTPQSFKVGECIRRIASQLTGSPPILKCSNERFQKSAAKLDKGDENDGIDGSPFIPEGSHRTRVILPKEHSSPDEMLSQLCLVARDPLRGYSFLTTIVGFFSDFRNSICLECPTSGKQKRSENIGGVKTGIGIRKPLNTETNFNRTFDFEEMSDSYWTDRIIQSSPEEQPSRRSRKRKGETHFEIYTELDTSSFEAEDPLQPSSVLDFEEQNLDDDYVLVKDKSSRKYQKKKGKSQLVKDEALDIELASIGDYDVVTGKPVRRLNEIKYVKEVSPAALLMSFSDSKSIPSEMNLNKIFRRFGPLKESETEVLRDTSSARVVFKKQTDAEVAFSSAAKFNIFGPQEVNYQLRSECNWNG